mgnify:CR=1 FL=1
MPVEVFVEACREDVKLPSYAKHGDSGMDVYSAEEVLINPSETVIVPSGIKLALPEGYEIQVRPRSGISFNTPLRLSNSPGTIDSGYRDELGILITNTSLKEEKNYEIFSLESKGNKNGIYKINKGDRIAQIVLQKVPVMKLTLVDNVKKIGNDRGGGIGSTGVY